MKLPLQLCSDTIPSMFQRIHDAFQQGDLEALRAAVDDPAAIPNGQMPITIGSCLVYAIYHSPLAFIRTLLEIGADPNAPADDGFPPLVNGLFYGIDGMRVGGTRRLEIAPHLAYGEKGVPGKIPENALITAEITVLAAT